MDFEIVPMLPEHIARIAALEKQCFSMPWSIAMLADELRNPKAVYFAAISGGKTIGYAGMYAVMDEGYVTNLAVDPDSRRTGVGRALLATLCSAAAERSLSFLTLEVRKRNLSAINLYGEAGFVMAGQRKGYYRDPAEDALIMTLWLNKKN